MIVIGYFVGKVADLRFQRRLGSVYETFAKLSELASVFQRTMLDDPFARLETKIEAVE